MAKPRKVPINNSLNWTQLKMAESVKSLFFEVDEENNIKAMPVVLMDPRFALTSIAGHISALDTAGLTHAVGSGGYTSIDYYPTVDHTWGLLTQASQYVVNKTFAQMEVVRTPSIWKSVETAVAAATTDLWTPAAGKKFRVLGGTVCMGGTIAAAAKRSLTLIEETAGTVIGSFGIDIPILGGNIAVPFDLRPNGFLASTADKKLQVVTAGATYVTGSDWVSVWGTEE